MTLRSLREAWASSFFEPQPPTPLALFRILYGLVLMADLLFLHADWNAWFGVRGLLTLETARILEPGTRLNLFTVVPQSDAWVNTIFWFALVSAFLLTIGLWTRISSIAVFLSVVSICQRNVYILTGGDALLRVCGFFLMFAPAGAAISIDRLIRIWRGEEGLEIRPRAPWAQRMIQLQTSVMYIMTAWTKTLGNDWVDGSALYYVYNVEQFKRFPIPDFLRDPAVAKLETWATLALETALGTLVWIKEFRYPLLLMGVILHLSIEYSMNIQLFEWVVLATYVTFVDPADLTRVWAWIRRAVTSRAGEPRVVPYDVGSVPAVNVLRALDGFQRIRFVQQPNAAPVSILALLPSLVPLPAAKERNEAAARMGEVEAQPPTRARRQRYRVHTR